MQRRNLFLEESELRAYEGTSLSNKIAALLNHQKVHWPLLRENAQKRAMAEVKKLSLGSFEVLVQCNPERMQSTTARVDEASVQQRPCKLCLENLYPEEKGLAYADHLIVLGNPFPILERHLAVVDERHVPQEIAGRVGTMLDLAKDISREFFVFYNGPHCGASSPDHFHFQAGHAELLPIRRHIELVERVPELKRHKHQVVRDDHVSIFTLDDYHVNFFSFCSQQRNALAERLLQTIDNLQSMTRSAPEPLINVATLFDSSGWTVYLFPRAKHRPDCYHRGELLLSPASLDMAGLLVIPSKEHFDKISAQKVRDIYAEVTLTRELFSELIHAAT